MFAAPALLLGLSARLLLDYVSHSGEQTFHNIFMLGLWEGVLWCIVKSHDLAIPVGLGIAAKEVITHTYVPNSFKSITSILGIVIGAVCTDILSGIIDQPDDALPTSSSKSHHHSSSRNTRSHGRKSTKHSSSQPQPQPQPNGEGRFHPPRRTTSDITSVDSDSELIGPKTIMSPLEREVAALRARASLADSERRRFKEEKKWALADGNVELAKQLKWQAQKYSALMKSFHREADQKLLQAARPGSGSSLRTRLQPIEEQNDTLQPSPTASHNGRQRKSSKTEYPMVNVDISPTQVKSAIRVNVR